MNDERGEREISKSDLRSSEMELIGLFVKAILMAGLDNELDDYKEDSFEIKLIREQSLNISAQDYYLFLLFEGESAKRKRQG